MRCDRRRLRHDRRHRPLPGQGLSLHAAGSRWRPEPRRHAPQRPLRHAAADLEHVSPLPRPARLPRRTGDLHFRGHLERQPDRAQTRREAVLQERACTRAHQTRGRRIHGDAGAGGGCAGRQHPAELPQRRVRPGAAGSNDLPLRRLIPKGRGNGLVRAWLDHHRVRARRLRPVRRRPGRNQHPDGPAADAPALMQVRAPVAACHMAET